MLSMSPLTHVHQLSRDVILADVEILIVCTANVCRSALAQVLLRQELARLDIPANDVLVRSAGTHATEGIAMCSVPAGMGYPWDGEHRSHLLATADIDRADLVLCLHREHLTHVVSMSPGSRRKCFSLSQAAMGVQVMVQPREALDVAAGRSQGLALEFEPGDPLQFVPPLPQGAGARLHWMVHELDAGRGSVQLTDIDDPHASPREIHDAVAQQIASSALSFVMGMREVLHRY